MGTGVVVVVGVMGYGEGVVACTLCLMLCVVIVGAKESVCCVDSSECCSWLLQMVAKVFVGSSAANYYRNGSFAAIY